MSGETKWTPGPWRANRNSSFWEIEPESRDRGINGIPYTVGDVCSTDPGRPDDGKQEANAHLIAAAPDLYEALEEARGTIQALIDEGYTGHIDQRGRIDAALAKARGE